MQLHTFLLYSSRREMKTVIRNRNYAKACQWRKRNETKKKRLKRRKLNKTVDFLSLLQSHFQVTRFLITQLTGKIKR